jgi:cell division protein FtsI/penicillin-binding protein 2
VPVQALRGEIFDRNGRVLVKNEPTFDLITRPNLILKYRFLFRKDSAYYFSFPDRK